jgi:tripartite-type tricarboxylate transporter receptor subunit TctC
MSNEVTMGFFNIPLVIGQIRSGRLKALAVTSLERSPLMPSVPTLDEQGVKGLRGERVGGFVAPAGTRPDIIARLNEELIRILASAEAKQKLEPLGFDLPPPLSPAAFSKLIADDLTRWVPVVKASRANAD